MVSKTTTTTTAKKKKKLNMYRKKRLAWLSMNQSVILKWNWYQFLSVYSSKLSEKSLYHHTVVVCRNRFLMDKLNSTKFLKPRKKKMRRWNKRLFVCFSQLCDLAKIKSMNSSIDFENDILFCYLLWSVEKRKKSSISTIKLQSIFVCVLCDKKIFVSQICLNFN